MKGSEIINIIQGKKNVAVQVLAGHFINDERTETLAVGCHIILVDLQILLDVNNDMDLEKAVQDEYDQNGSYAGLDDRDEDNGLSWACHSDLWDALNKTALHLR